MFSYHWFDALSVPQFQGIDNMMTFHWLAPPSAEAMVKALETLHAIGAVGDDARLTRDIGARLAEIPLDPLLAKALIVGADLGCAADVATIVAMLSVQSVWSHGMTQHVLQEAKDAFAVAEGDLISYLNVWRAWNDEGRRQRWCSENGIDRRAMLRAADVRTQLLSRLKRMKLSTKSAMDGVRMGSRGEQSKEALRRIRKALVSGLFLNAASLRSNDVAAASLGLGESVSALYRLVRGSPGTVAGEARLRMHASSVLHKCRPTWVCFVRAQQAGGGWFEMQDLVTTDADMLRDVAPRYFTLAPLRNSDISPIF